MKHKRIWSIAVCGGICVVLVCVLLMLARRKRVPARALRGTCMQMAWYAFYNYDTTFGTLPRDVMSVSGVPLSSWRFVAADDYMIIPPMDKKAAWNSPANRGAITEPYPVFCFDELSNSDTYLETKVLAVRGPDTGFDPEQKRTLWELFDKLPHDLILLIEVWDTGIHWMQPGDLEIRAGERIPTAGPDGRGFFVAFADGAVWYIRAHVPQETLKHFCTIKGAFAHDRDDLLGPFSQPQPSRDLPITKPLGAADD